MAMYNTVIIENFNENTKTVYYIYNYVDACNFIRQEEREMDDVEWVRGEDYEIYFGEDVELDDTDDLEQVQPGVYTDND